MSGHESQHHAGRQAFNLPPGAVALALGSKYVGLSVYGVWAALVEVPTFVAVGGSGFATLWASLVAVLAALAAIGVIVTWRTGSFKLIKFATAALICGFLAYTVALIVRGTLLSDWAAIPLAVLPVVLCIFPAIHRFWLAGR